MSSAMNQPRISIVGTGGTSFVGHALSLYRKYNANKQFPRTLQLGPAIMLFNPDDIKIIMIIYNYALFSFNPASQTFFSLLDANPPLNWQVTGGQLPSLPGFFPINPGSNIQWPIGICVPLYNELTNYIDGQTIPCQIIPFQTSILSFTTPVQSLVWEDIKEYLNQSSGNQWYLTTYFLENYNSAGGTNINITPVSMKMLIASPTLVNLFEFNASAPILIFISLMNQPDLFIPGIFFRRMFISISQENMTAYSHNPTTYSGALYLISEVSNVLTLSSLFTAPAGNRANPPATTKGTPTAGSLYTDNTLDIFTSVNSKYYYVVSQTINTATDYNMGFSDHTYDPSGCDTYIFPGMSLKITQYNKSTLVVGETWVLNPSSIDTILQGFVSTISNDGGILNNRVNANGNINANGTFASPNLPIQTSFVFKQGFVLIDTSGNEYPVISGVSLSQNFYNDSGTDANLFCQPILLWLGTPPVGFDCYTWPGVQAAGLKINGALPGLRNDAQLGDLCYPEDGIGDSSNILISFASQYSQNTFDSVNYSGASCTVRYSDSGTRAGVDDRVGYSPGDLFFVDNQVIYTMGGTDSATLSGATVVPIIMANINASGTYTASNMTTTVINSVLVYEFTLTRKDGQANTVQLGYTSIWGYRIEQRVFSIQLVDNAPLVTLQAIQHKDLPLFMFDI